MGATISSLFSRLFGKTEIRILMVWDAAGGGDKLRPLWYHYYDKSRAVIFVIDSTDRERIEEAEFELKRLFSRQELENAVLLVLANKQDLPNAMTIDEITGNLRLNELSNQRWHVQLASAIQGHGMYEALDWLANELAE